MTYIIAEPCVNVKDGSCIDVCPVDCIYTTSDDSMMYINPDECIDCAACEPVCPVVAIFVEDQVPEQWQNYIPMNYDYFEGQGPGRVEGGHPRGPQKHRRGLTVVFSTAHRRRAVSSDAAR